MTWTAWAAWTKLHWTATAAPPHTRRCPEPPPPWPTRCRGGSSMRGLRRSDSSRRGRPTPSSGAAPPARRRACSARSPRRGRAARGGSCKRRRHTSPRLGHTLAIKRLRALYAYTSTSGPWTCHIYIICTGVYLTRLAGLSGGGTVWSVVQSWHTFFWRGTQHNAKCSLEHRAYFLIKYMLQMHPRSSPVMNRCQLLATHEFEL